MLITLKTIYILLSAEWDNETIHECAVGYAWTAFWRIRKHVMYMYSLRIHMLFYSMYILPFSSYSHKMKIWFWNSALVGEWNRKRKVSFKAHACLVLTNIKRGSLFCDVFTHGNTNSGGEGTGGIECRDNLNDSTSCLIPNVMID